MQCWEKLGAPYFTEQGLEAQGSEGAVGATCAWAAEPSRSRPSSRLITECRSSSQSAPPPWAPWAHHSSCTCRVDRLGGGDRVTSQGCPSPLPPLPPGRTPVQTSEFWVRNPGVPSQESVGRGAVDEGGVSVSQGPVLPLQVCRPPDRYLL